MSCLIWQNIFKKPCNWKLACWLLLYVPYKIFHSYEIITECHCGAYKPMSSEDIARRCVAMVQQFDSPRVWEFALYINAIL